MIGELPAAIGQQTRAMRRAAAANGGRLYANEGLSLVNDEPARLMLRVQRKMSLQPTRTCFPLDQ